MPIVVGCWLLAAVGLRLVMKLCNGERTWCISMFWLLLSLKLLHAVASYTGVADLVAFAAVVASVIVAVVTVAVEVL